MKRKLITIILITILFLILVINYQVKAFEGELIPDNYIIVPEEIMIENGVGRGTISLTSNAAGYSMQYQKIDITLDKFNNIDNKGIEFKTFISENSAIKTQKENELKELENTYKNLQSSGTATEEEITEAYNTYYAKYTEYEEFYKNIKEESQKLLDEYFDLVPSYTSSWKNAPNTQNNIELDFNNYSGTVHFVLWVKITNGTNTYYTVIPYSTSITSTEEQPNEDENDESTTEKDWTDFSNAKFQLSKDGISGVMLEVTGVTPKTDTSRGYALYILNNNEKPSISELNREERISLLRSDNKLIAFDFKLENIIEKNQKMYAVIVESNNRGEEKIVSYGTELFRFSENKYSDAFLSTSYVSNNSTKITTNFTHSIDNDRKLEIKIGKITDSSILKKIKQQDSAGFEELLNFAKTSESLYNGVVNIENETFMEYDTSNPEEVIQLKGLENGEYYYLYVKTDDENGKYISNEAVTLAQADVYSNENWNLFFYGKDDFKWLDFDSIDKVDIDDTGKTEPEDPTIAPDKLPQTGVKNIIIIMIGTFVIVGIIAKVKYKKYNF